MSAQPLPGPAYARPELLDSLPFSILNESSNCPWL